MITGKELAQKVLDHVEAHPDQHDQSIWVDNPAPDATSLCNTTACLAGWAVLLNRRENEPPYRTLSRLAVETGAHEDWEEVAISLLGGEHHARLSDAFHTVLDRGEAIQSFAEVFDLDVPEA